VQVGALNRAIWLEKAKAARVEEDMIEKVWSQFRGTVWDKGELVERVSRDIPELAQLFNLWTSSGLAGATLTSVGIAIAHANVQRISKAFDADLSIWIK
jgi:hypothetical protein